MDKLIERVKAALARLEAERDRLKEQLQTAERERDGLHLENDERGARINDLLEQLEAAEARIAELEKRNDIRKQTRVDI